MDEPRDPQDAASEYTRQPTLDDLVGVCRLLNREGARYAILGGMAVNYYGLPRATHDIDLLVDDAPENMERVIRALGQLPDRAALELQPDELQRYPVIRINDEITVDLLAQAVDVTYQDAASRLVRDGRYGEPIPFLGLSDLIRSKATYREKDRQDLLFLQSLRPKS